MSNGHLKGLEQMIKPKEVVITNGTRCTIVPFTLYDAKRSPNQMPEALKEYIREILNTEIVVGNTYPMMKELDPEEFQAYWLTHFCGVLLKGQHNAETVLNQPYNWRDICLGSFYIKPNYPGRSSHICNGGFVVAHTARNQKVGVHMAEAYLDWAAELGYVYSVFNLVYSTNAPSIRLWEKLGFTKLGKIPGAGKFSKKSSGPVENGEQVLDHHESYEDEYADAYIYGRALGEAAEGIVTDNQFERIKYYIEHGTYPQNIDTKVKNQLRSATKNYKLVNNELWTTGDKRVIWDPVRQKEICLEHHIVDGAHQGINKTCANVTALYHWTGIKQTTSQVVKECKHCQRPAVAEGRTRRRSAESQSSGSRSPRERATTKRRIRAQHTNAHQASHVDQQPLPDMALAGQMRVMAMENTGFDQEFVNELNVAAYSQSFPQNLDPALGASDWNATHAAQAALQYTNFGDTSQSAAWNGTTEDEELDTGAGTSNHL
jgi:RimJ/RimL family protein N-acetyltransferase